MASTINPDEYRWDGEKRSLHIGFLFLVICFIFIAGLSFGIAIVVVVITAVAVWIMQGQQIGNMVKIDEHQFPEVHSLSILAGRRLTMTPQQVFIKYDPKINASAIGFLREKNVVLHSETVEAMTAKELLFIIGHEFSHIKCGHTDLMVLISPNESVVGIIGSILGLFFNNWSQKAEFTCDRAGLLACRSLEASVGAMCKLAIGGELFKKLDIEKFLEQHHHLDGDDISKLSELFQTHPYLIRRVKALRDFWNSDLYTQLASRAS